MVIAFGAASRRTGILSGADGSAVKSALVAT
jgi:hypothetical protein